jgi:hypothetical protein
MIPWRAAAALLLLTPSLAAGPGLLVAQTGYMQGAAGIGMWLLRLDAAETGRRVVRFPDDPW